MRVCYTQALLGVVRREVVEVALERFQSTANSVLDCFFTHFTTPVCPRKDREYFCLFS